MARYSEDGIKEMFFISEKRELEKEELEKRELREPHEFDEKKI